MKKFLSLILLVAVAFSVSVSSARASDHPPAFAKESKIEIKKIDSPVFVIETQADQALLFVSIERCEMYNADVAGGVSQVVQCNEKKEDQFCDNYFYPTNHERIRAGLSNLYAEGDLLNYKNDPPEKTENKSGIHPDPGRKTA